VQVEPMQSVLTAPETKRLKLKYDELLPKYGFIFNLRRYNEAEAPRRKKRKVALSLRAMAPGRSDLPWEPAAVADFEVDHR